MKNGHGKFFFLDTGQLYKGVWVDDIPKCGKIIDFNRDSAPYPTKYPIPKVRYLISLQYLKRMISHLTRIITY